MGFFRRIVENAEIHGGGFLDFLAKYKNRGGEVFRVFPKTPKYLAAGF